MNAKLIFQLLIILLSNHRIVAAQTDEEVPLTDDDIKQFKERAGVMIDTFQDNLSIIGSKEEPDYVKEYYADDALELFIDRGDSVTMEVSSTRRTYPTRYPLKTYLQRLANLCYAKVEIKQAGAYYMSNIYKVGKNKYRGLATAFQRFCGYNRYGDRYVKRYCDLTKKNIEFYIILKETWDGQKYWIVKLGNISVADTTPAY